jgi:hypothetical protein
MPRAATPGFIRPRRQSSDPGLGYRYDEDVTIPFEDRMPRRRSPRPRPVSHRQASYQCYSSDMDQDWYALEAPRASSRTASRRRERVEERHRRGQLHIGPFDMITF